MSGSLWKNSTLQNPNPFSNLSLPDIKKELHSRHKVTNGSLKPELSERLKDILHGVQRLPDVLFNTPASSLSDLNCSKWEVVESEFMHDFLNCFSNFMEEITYHPCLQNPTAKEKVKALFKHFKGDRTHFRGCDARLASVHLTLLLKSSTNQNSFPKSYSIFLKYTWNSLKLRTQKINTEINAPSLDIITSHFFLVIS